MAAYLLAVAIIAGIYLLLTLGLNLQYGFTGLINFGHVGFFAIGAYTSALLALRGLPIPLSLLAAMILAALAAWPLGLLSQRLRVEYLAIATLGFSEAVRLVIIEEAWLTNGVHGITGIPPIGRFEKLGLSASLVTLLGLVLAGLLAVLVFRRLVHSPFGRVIEAIRDDEDAVRALGKDPGGFKIRVFMIGAALAGLAGGFYAHYIGYLSPDQFLPLVTFYVWVAMVLGGAGRIGGAVAGTAALIFFLEGSRFLRDALPWVSAVEMASVRLGVVGLALILLMLYRPGGILGGIEEP